MAAISLPPPGAKLGPCAEPCQHPDCAEMRRMAADPCALCGEPIGYERRFYSTPDWIEPKHVSPSVHASCLEDEADRQRDAQP